MIMQAGRLRHRVRFERQGVGSPSQDAGGVPDDTWAAFYSTYALFETLAGRELVAAQQMHSEVTGKITLRYRADKIPTAAMRVVFGSRYLEVLAVLDPEERKELLVCYTKEGMNDG